MASIDRRDGKNRNGHAGRIWPERGHWNCLREHSVAGSSGSVDAGLSEMFKIHGAGRIRTWWSLGLPWSLPSVFTGLRIAAGLAVIGAIVGEFVGAFGGDRAPLGAIITSALKQNQTSTVFAAVALAAMLGFALFGFVNLVGWLLLGRWHESAR